MVKDITVFQNSSVVDLHLNVMAKAHLAAGCRAVRSIAEAWLGGVVIIILIVFKDQKY